MRKFIRCFVVGGGILLFLLSACSFYSASEIEQVYLKHLPYKTSYYVGEELDFTGLEIYGFCSDNCSRPISQYASSMAEHTVLSETGNFDIVFTVENKFSVSCPICVQNTDIAFSNEVLTLDFPLYSQDQIIRKR